MAPYDGYSAPHVNRKRYVMTKEERAKKKEVITQRHTALGAAVKGAIKAKRETTSNIATEFGLSQARVELMVGAKGNDSAASRAPNPYNAFQTIEIARLNEGTPSSTLHAHSRH